ncbi:hypothetical protein [Labilibaculum euxinus]
MKRPFEFVMDNFFENLDKVKENQRYNFNNSERFMIWIVGFSIGGLSIIVANLTKFTNSFDHSTIKTILILLSTSIISGILYRWFFYIYQIHYQSIEFYLQGAFSNQQIMEVNPDDISKENDIKEVIRRLKIDYDDDVSHVLDEYSKLNQEGKLIVLNDLKARYQTVAQGVKGEYEFAMNYAKDTYKEAFGLSNKSAERMFQPNSSKRFKLFGRLTSFSFLISCLSFIAVVIILCIKY